MVLDPFRLLTPEQYVLFGLSLVVAAQGSMAIFVLEFQNQHVGSSAPISRTKKFIFGGAIAVSGFYYVLERPQLMDAMVAVAAVMVLGLPVAMTILVIRQLVVKQP